MLQERVSDETACPFLGRIHRYEFSTKLSSTTKDCAKYGDKLFLGDTFSTEERDSLYLRLPLMFPKPGNSVWGLVSDFLDLRVNFGTGPDFLDWS